MRFRFPPLHFGFWGDKAKARTIDALDVNKHPTIEHEVDPVIVTAPPRRWTVKTPGDHWDSFFKGSDFHTSPPQTFKDFEIFVDNLQDDMVLGSHHRTRETSVPFFIDKAGRPVVTRRIVGPAEQKRRLEPRGEVATYGDNAHLHLASDWASSRDLDNLQQEIAQDPRRIILVQGRDDRVTLYGTAEGIAAKTPYSTGEENRMYRKAGGWWLGSGDVPTAIYGVQIRPPAPPKAPPPR